jgi:adenine-specific DNA glycosylase
VLARLADSADPSPATLRDWAGALVDPVDPGGFNQGLMELGARICVPRNPTCGVCPVRGHCLAARRGTVAERPTPKRRRPPREVAEVVVVLARGPRGRERVLFRRRPERGLLGGMWELPGTSIAAGEPPEALALRLAATWARRPRLVSRLDRLDHAFTHRRVAYLPFYFRAGPGGYRRSGASPFELDGTSFRWARLGSEVRTLPLPAAQRRIVSAAFGPLK